MNRRDAVLVLMALGLAPVSALAQPPAKVRRIGILYPGSQADSGVLAELFVKALRDLGHIEGRNIAIEWRYADGPSCWRRWPPSW